MIDTIRNLIGTVAAFAGALLVTGGVQEAFRRLWPEASGRFVFNIDLATYVALLLFAVTFFLVGYFLRGWIRSRFSLMWLLLPVFGLWLLMRGGWYMLTCNPEFLAYCVLNYSLLVVPLAAAVIGYSVRPYLPPIGWRQSSNNRMQRARNG